MKKIYTFMAIAMGVVVMSLTSCGGGVSRNTNGSNMSKQADIDLAVEYAKQFVGENDAVVKVSFVPIDDKSVMLSAGFMRIYLYADGDSDKLSVLLCPLTSGSKKPYVEETFDAGYKGMDLEDGVKLADIDFSKVAAYVNQAGNMVVAADDLYEANLHFSGFSYLNMTFEGDGKNPYYDFIIESKDFETSTADQDDYYPFEFEVIDGKLISADDLEEAMEE